MTTKTKRNPFIPRNVRELNHLYGMTYIWLDDAVEEITGKYTSKGEYNNSYTPPPFSVIERNKK